jgi:hypothetical protein
MLFNATLRGFEGVPESGQALFVALGHGWWSSFPHGRFPWPSRASQRPVGGCLYLVCSMGPLSLVGASNGAFIPPSGEAADEMPASAMSLPMA